MNFFNSAFNRLINGPSREVFSLPERREPSSSARAPHEVREEATPAQTWGFEGDEVVPTQVTSEEVPLATPPSNVNISSSSSSQAVKNVAVPLDNTPLEVNIANLYNSIQKVIVEGKRFHMVGRDLLALMKLSSKDMETMLFSPFRELFTQLLTKDIPGVYDLLDDTVSAERFSGPMLLDSGHTISRQSLHDHVTAALNDRRNPTNPFTRAPLIYEEDTLTATLLEVLKDWEAIKFAVTTEAAKTAIGELSCIQGDIYWMYLLKAFMPVDRYFVYQKEENRFVLVVRPDLTKEKKDSYPEGLKSLLEKNNVLAISFYIDAEGKIQRLDLNGEGYADIKALLSGIHCGELPLTAFTQDESKNMGTLMGIESFIEKAHANNTPEEKCAYNLIQQLRVGLTESKANEFFIKYPGKMKGKFVCRPGITSNDRPTFTLHSFFEGLAKAGKIKMTIDKGQICLADIIPFAPISIHANWLRCFENNNIPFINLNLFGIDENANGYIQPGR